MKYIWYEALLEGLRHHIELHHMHIVDALSELSFTEEYLSYAHFIDDEKVTIGCPFSEECKCDWEIQGHIEFKLVRIK